MGGGILVSFVWVVVDRSVDGDDNKAMATVFSLFPIWILCGWW